MDAGSSQFTSDMSKAFLGLLGDPARDDNVLNSCLACSSSCDAVRGETARGDAVRGEAARGDAARGDAARGDVERGDAI